MSSTFFSFILLLAAAQCGSSSTEKMSVSEFPDQYDFNNHVVLSLPLNLKEISGLEWVDGRLWAIEDETGSIYQVDPTSGRVLDRRVFGKNGDYEDILVAEGVAWVLESNGILHEVQDPFGADAEHETYKFPIKETRDFESFLLSPDGSAIWSICKDCKWDKDEKEASIYSFDLEKKSYSGKAMTQLVKKEFEERLGRDLKKEVKVQPSAAAFHPLEEKYYIISSTGGWLGIFSKDLEVEHLYLLDPEIFRQPEGIAFSPEGDLYISNEALGAPANILVFRLKK
ncbi:hypothetical protein [Algoriphagus namhaensis]